MMHDFAQSLKASHAQADAPWWEPVYRNAFPDFAVMHCVRQDGWAQRGGIDRVIVLKSGKTLTVDEKVRTKQYPDILLERWSDRARKKAGWVQKALACDYIAVACIPTQTCHLLPFQQLRRAWILHGHEWIARYEPVLADNPGYVTESIPVPVDVLFGALMGAMTVHWASAADPGKGALL